MSTEGDALYQLKDQRPIKTALGRTPRTVMIRSFQRDPTHIRDPRLTQSLVLAPPENYTTRPFEPRNSVPRQGIRPDTTKNLACDPKKTAGGGVPKMAVLIGVGMAALYFTMRR